MAQIQIRRSTTPNATPASLALGEFALGLGNTPRKLWVGTPSGVQELLPALGGPFLPLNGGTLNAVTDAANSGNGIVVNNTSFSKASFTCNVSGVWSHGIYINMSSGIGLGITCAHGTEAQTPSTPYNIAIATNGYVSVGSLGCIDDAHISGGLGKTVPVIYCARFVGWDATGTETGYATIGFVLRGVSGGVSFYKHDWYAGLRNDGSFGISLNQLISPTHDCLTINRDRKVFVAFDPTEDLQVATKHYVDQGAGTAVEDAEDDAVYGRCNGNWVKQPIVSATAPADPAPNTLWWDSISGKLFVWYTDPTSSQWVEIAAQGPQGNTGLRGERGEKGPPGEPGGGSALGVTDGSNASAGQVGEYLQVSDAASVVLPPGANITLISLALSPGDWDVTGWFSYIVENISASATNYSLFVFLATNPSDNPQLNRHYAIGGSLSAFQSIIEGASLGPLRINSSVPSTVYLVLYLSGANIEAYTATGGRNVLQARRMR